MKRFVRASFTLALLAATVALLPSPSVAQDGPIRQRLKERWLQTQQFVPEISLSTSTDAKITQAGDYAFALEHDGLKRMYRIHVPAKYDPGTPAALLFAMHGGGGNMDFQANDARYGLIGKSERDGFIVVFPNGFSELTSGKFATWNAGDCCGEARDKNVDDVGFIRQVVANITRQMNIDRARIYATGMSNGGLMAYRLACEMSDVFKAIAAVAGTDNTRSCSPAHPVAILHLHAKNDTHVIFTGGAGPGVRNKSIATEFTSVSATVSKWVGLNNCSATPQRIIDKPGAYCELYSPCRENGQVQLCVTESGGHSWPGAEKTRGEPASQAISANDVMWDFFNRR